MKTLYIDCGMGAAGDMLTAALIELMEDKEAVINELNEIGIPGVEYKLERTEKCGITGSHIHVLVNGEEESVHEHHHDHDHDHNHDHDHGHEHHHSHSSMHGIGHIVNDHLNLDETVKKDIMNVYQLIADAESEVHGVSVDEIHFHEVGTMDAVADVSAVSYLLNKLKVDQIICSPIHVGKGTVKCAHGILPVPAPATAIILKGLPIYSREEINGELCTPTGAALLKYYVKEYGDMPVMSVEKIGYGMGTKDFPIANCVRVFLGETKDTSEEIIELNFNVDDMTAEDIAFATNMFMEKGALDVFTTAIGMKKNRPGTLITVITNNEKKDELVKTIFRYTTTLGIRQTNNKRYTLERKITKKDTQFGEVRKKESCGYGVNKSKYEFDDLADIALKNDLSIAEVREALKDNE